MKPRLSPLVTALTALLIYSSSAWAQARQRTTTLLPVNQAVTADGGNGLFWIQNSPERVVFLQFDLSRLPAGLTAGDIRQVTLRLAAQNVVYQPADNPNTGSSNVIVKAQLATADLKRVESQTAILSLSTLSDSRKIGVSGRDNDALAAAVYDRYSKDKKISFRLFTDTSKGSTLFYSTTNTAGSASNLPRLVIEYTAPAPSLLESYTWSQHQQNPEHTGRSAWSPFAAPAGFTLERIDLPGGGTIADYPLIYRGSIYAVNKTGSANILLALDFEGRELWRKDLGGGTVQRSPAIGPSGLLYVATETQLAAYDLSKRGEAAGAFTLSGKLSPYTDMTAGNDGSLFLALQENDVHYIYGFTSDLKPFLKSAALGKGQDKISSVSVSPDGRRILAQAPAGGIAIDIANPSDTVTVQLQRGQDRPWEYVHTPVSAPGGVMVFADFSSTGNKGNVWGNTSDKGVWAASGTLIPQPVLGSNGRAYYIQDGALQGHAYNQSGSATIKAGTGLNSTGNLVVDGANNIYFWDNGYLYGLNADGNPLFDRQDFTGGPAARTGDGPEQFLRLMLGPDGTLWANNRNGASLYLFKPRFKDPRITLQPADVKTQTVYRAEDVVAVGAATVAEGTNIVIQGGKGVGFSSGFSVKTGGSVLVRTGF